MRWLAKPYVYIPISGLLLAFTLSHLKPDELTLHLGLASVLWLLVAVVINLSALPLWALRSKLALGALGYEVSLPSLLLLSSFANVANQILPAASGEVARGAYLSSLYEVPGPTVTAVLVFERLCGFALMTITSAAAILFATKQRMPALLVGLGATLILIAGLRLVGSLRTTTDSAATTGESHRSRLTRALLKSAVDMRSLLRNLSFLLQFLLVSLAIFGLLTIGYMCAAHAIGLNLSAISAWGLHGGGMVIGTLSALPFGLGAVEASVLTIGHWLLIGVNMIVLATLAMRLTLTLPLGAVGTVSYFLLSRRLRSKLALATHQPQPTAERT